MKKKKILIIIAVLLISLIGVILISNTLKNKKQVNPIEEENKDIDTEVINRKYNNIVSYDENGLIRLYSENGELLDTVDLRDMEDKENEAEDKGHFEAFRTVDNKLILKDRNMLFSIDSNEEKIEASKIFTNYDFNNLKSVSIDDNNIYLSYKDEKDIREINKDAATSGDLKEEDVRRYTLEESPDLMFIDNGNIYYTLSNRFGQLNLTDKINRTIDVGDKSLDMLCDDEYIYLINDFGKGLGNSVLIKIEKNSILVNEILGLKGMNTMFIGNENNIIYFKQSDSIKTVENLNKLKPLNSYKCDDAQYSEFKDGLLYEVANNHIKIFDIANKEGIIKEFDIDGSGFMVIEK